MSGSLLLILLAAWMQNAGEQLPLPNRGAAVMPPVMPPTFSDQTGTSNSGVMRGWGTDKVDGKFAFIIQIPPESIAEFARGPVGQELPAEIPENIRGYIQKVIVRIGVGQLEQSPPNSQSFGDARINIGTPYVATLDGRSPVTIDNPGRYSDTMTAGGGLGLTNNNAPNTGYSRDEAIMPPHQQQPSGMFTNNNQVGLGSNTQASAPNPSPTGGVSNASSNGLFPPDGSTASNNRIYGSLPSRSEAPQNAIRDGWTAANSNSPRSSIGSFLQPSNRPNATNGPYAGDTYPPFNSRNSFETGPDRSYLQTARNPNPMQYPNEPYSWGTYNPQNPNNPSISQGQAQQYGFPTPQTNPSMYASGLNTNPNANFYQPQISPSFAGIPSGSSPRVAGGMGAASTDPFNLVDEPPPLPKDKWMPFFLLFSIVGNLYLGLWMNHLRNRHRKLLANIRGVSLPDLG